MVTASASPHLTVRRGDIHDGLEKQTRDLPLHLFIEKEAVKGDNMFQI